MSETPDRPTGPERTDGAGRRSAGAGATRVAAERRTGMPGDAL
ncbi:hypothetical protein [Streptomyces sp. E-15]